MSKIEIVKEGITHLHTDAVVNAANKYLQEGGGVCGVIFRTAGSRQLQQACDKIGGCPTGSAVITPAFQLDAKYIIHAVGPRWHGGGHGEAKFLQGAYYRSLELAKENGCKSIGFPLISAGIFGYPVDKAWEVAIKACKQFVMEQTDYDILIRFGVPDEENRRIGREILDELDEMNFQRVREAARERLPEADYCTEYTDAYVFSIKNYISFGGDKSPVAVMKQTGEVMGMTAYLSQNPEGKIIREFDL